MPRHIAEFRSTWLGWSRRTRAGLRASWGVVLLTVAAGCASGIPNLRHPGDLVSQRYNAIAHDPYTDTDAAPEVVGGRPRDYQKPLPEPVRNRWLMDSWWSRR